IDPIDVRIRPRTHTIEVFDDSVSNSQIASALQSLNIDHGKVTDGVTKKTRSEVVSTLQSKIDKTGLSGGTVTTVGDNLVVVEVPNTKPQEVKNIVSDRGVVRVIAEVQNGNTTTNKTVLTASDLTQIGAVGQRDSGGWEVPVTVKQGAANRFQQEMNDLGFTGPGVGRCARTGTGSPGSSWCLLTTLDGKLVRANSMGPGLARDMQDGSWAKTQSFTIGAPTFKSAQELKISLQVGSLPTKLDLSGSKYDLSYLQPSLAQKFKPYSLLTGLVAWLAVSGVIFFRYRKVAVAVPMLLTAAAEVFILLGFAAATGLALNLSHIAGLIAVIGTGVDDLVIIADEVLQQGDVATGRVFQNRFRKAFWVIGGA
ncbi:MAG: preprotein translocase subunit SecD, partial [Halapricum sp.]